MEGIKALIESLDFIDVCHVNTGIYDTNESQAPRVYDGRGREYTKLNIADTAKGIAWTYEPNSTFNSGNKVSTVELYVIVNTEKSGLTGKNIDNPNVEIDIQKDILNKLIYETDIDVVTHASEALSRYRNFYETNKQIGKVPYLVYRFTFEYSYEFC